MEFSLKCTFFFKRWTKIAQLYLVVFLLLLISCVPKNQEDKSNGKPISDKNFPKYAKGFEVIQSESVLEIRIFDPYIERKLLQKCWITKDGQEMSEIHFTYPDMVIRNPKKIVALSATQWGLFFRLGKEELISGISEARFVQNPQMRHLLESGSVIEVASDASFKQELLALLQPDIILVSPDANGLPVQLTQSGLPVLAWPDYFENEPLGRAEWIRIAGLISGQTQLADSLFFEMEAEYLRLTQLVNENETERPTVFSDKIFAGQWYIPGGESYMAKIFRDAGADYLFSDNTSRASFPIDTEAIVSRVADADYWRVAQAASSYSYQDLKLENELYAGFKAFKNKKVIFCNTAKTAYFEESPMYPHLVLADFIAIFHPEKLPDHQAVYHHLLK